MSEEHETHETGARSGKTERFLEFLREHATDVIAHPDTIKARPDIFERIRAAGIGVKADKNVTGEGQIYAIDRRQLVPKFDVRAAIADRLADAARYQYAKGVTMEEPKALEFPCTEGELAEFLGLCVVCKRKATLVDGECPDCRH